MADTDVADDQTRRGRYARGKALRKSCPREKHGEFAGRHERDPVAILAEGDVGRIPRLLPVRYARMTQSPFAFLRGAADVMAADLAGEPMAGVPVQGCGDCHIMNFGAFASPEDNILFDINDFDETLPGVDFTLDLKRLAASVAVAAQAGGFSDRKARAFAASSVAAYRRYMADLALLSPLEIWHSRIDLPREIASFSNPALARRLRAALMKAGPELDRDDNFPHLATTQNGAARIADRGDTIFHLDPAETGETFDPQNAFAAYLAGLTPDRAALLSRYRLADFAFKVVGVGSVGTFCAIGLFLSGDGEPLFLQVKEARRSVLERVSPRGDAPEDQGRRVVEGQRVLQAASDVLLGWVDDSAQARHFYVRRLKNRRLGSLGEVLEGEALPAYARLCGRTLARAHARSGDPAVIAGYIGRSAVFDDALASFAMKYAKQTKADHAALVAAKGAPSDAAKKKQKKKAAAAETPAAA
ncbi:MAG TPA: DUF2252 domain-containing protein [Rhodoblastus sp.]|nr:DUF2252 domain-containing protein [Rhodoblastus sp.]